MSDCTQKYYGVKVQCVNTKNIYNVKYKYKNNKRMLGFIISNQIIFALSLATIFSVLLLGYRIIIQGLI